MGAVSAAADSTGGVHARVQVLPDDDASLSAGLCESLAIEILSAEHLPERLKTASAAVSVRPNRFIPAAAVLTCNHGAFTILRPSRNLPSGQTAELLQMAPHTVLSYGTLQRIGPALGIAVPDRPKGKTALAECAAEVMGAFHQAKLAGTKTSIVTLDAAGVLSADWLANEFLFFKLEPLDVRARIQAPQGLADTWLGAFVMYEAAWAITGFLRYPRRACIRRAIDYVLRRVLRVPREAYTVETVPI